MKLPLKGTRKNDFNGVSMHCAVCTATLSPNLRYDALTCSKECSDKRQAWIRSRKEQKECSLCHRPSTPEERANYRRFRDWERKGRTEDGSAAFLLREVQRLKRKLQELQDQVAVDAL